MFPGNVHGVVVHITNLSPFKTVSFPSTTVNGTKIDGSFLSLYSISASASAVSLLGDQ